ncbi:MAG: hypothetical protein OEL87_01280 [Nanoarchaeota archaeon]|nr:hypothetical protein [Nanoarchaeota archaeon]
MEKKIFWGFVFILMIGLVCAADEWGDISGGDNLTVDSVQKNVSVPGEVSNASSVQDEPIDTNKQDVVQDFTQSSEDSLSYTLGFYIALGLGVLALVLIIIFVYFFLRGPKNKWK